MARFTSRSTSLTFTDSEGNQFTAPVEPMTPDDLFDTLDDLVIPWAVVPHSETRLVWGQPRKRPTARQRRRARRARRGW